MIGQNDFHKGNKHFYKGNNGFIKTLYTREISQREIKYDVMSKGNGKTYNKQTQRKLNFVPFIMSFAQNLGEKTDLGFLKLLVTDAILSEIIA